MGHWINMRDLFAVFDPSITRLNCLKFSNRQWRFLNSPLIPQNRLRLSDYRALTTGAAFTILKEEVGFADKQELSSITLAPEFKHYSREDLLAIDLFLVA